MRQTRREFLKSLLYNGWKLLVGVSSVSIIVRFYIIKKKRRKAYQIDPEKCIACGICAKNCVRKNIPAIQAINDQEKCGFCDRCVAYFVEPENESEDEENLVCPNKALKRRHIGEFRFEYTVDLQRCKGCGKCVKLCKKKGQGSLRLFVNKALCLFCETCSAQKACNQHAFILVD